MYSDWMVLDESYRRIQVFCAISNCFWRSIIMPANIVLLVIGTSGCIFCTLRLHGHLQPVVYLFFPTMTIFLIGIYLFGVYRLISKVNENSCDCLNELVQEGKKLKALWAWNVGYEDTKCVEQKLRALRSFGVQVGIFGFITVSTQIAMWDQIINYVFLLLSL